MLLEIRVVLKTLFFFCKAKRYAMLLGWHRRHGLEHQFRNIFEAQFSVIKEIQFYFFFAAVLIL